MIRYFVNTIVCILILTCVGRVSAQDGERPTRILFVGNSFTYFYNLPSVVESMAKSKGVELYTRHSTVGGSTLEQHWKEEKGTRTRKLLDSVSWDYVVFNNHSLSTINNPDKFSEYSKKFTDWVRSKGAEPIFMQTWGYKSNPLMTRTIFPAYERLAQEVEVHVVPCGELFEEARRWRPDLKLFDDDKHPSSNGTYLMALAFLKYFTGLPTSDVNKRIWTEDQKGDRLYLLFLDQTDADFLQRLVDDYEFNYFAGR